MGRASGGGRAAHSSKPERPAAGSSYAIRAADAEKGTDVSTSGVYLAVGVSEEDGVERLWSMSAAIVWNERGRPASRRYDVVVVGSGGAGLTAALAAAISGARVLVAESANRFGGSTSESRPTTAWSWLPAGSSRQVLDWDGQPITGLFAAGNAADSVIGPGILSSGMTLGLALTWGWLAAMTAAASKPGAAAWPRTRTSSSQPPTTTAIPSFSFVWDQLTGRPAPRSMTTGWSRDAPTRPA